MKVLDLFFIFAVLIACCAGGIAVIASQNTTPGPDSFGNAPTSATNSSKDLVEKVTVMQADTSGWFLLLAAVAVIVVIMLGFFYSLRRGGLGRGKYRTG